MITIVGAGPAGSYLAYLLAKQGKKVMLLEEHNTIGSPVQCTGIVTHSIEKFFKLKNEVIAKKLDKVVVISKNNKITVNVDEIVMWRDKFDRFVAEMAQQAGAEILLNHQFIDFNGKQSIKVKDKKNNKIKEIKTEAIVGADGPYSFVAKAAGINSNSKHYIGIQAKVKLNMDITAFETYFGSNFPNFFGWCVPESEDIVRLGIGCFENAQEYFYKFLKNRTGKKDVLCWESGLIPLYNPKKVIQKDNVYLIGDAATQVKATSIDGDESILIKKNDLIRTVRIGEFVNKYLSNSKDIRTNINPVGYKELDLNDSIFAFSPTDKASDLKFRKVKKILKHKIDEDLFQIILEKGYRIKVTGSHSVMTIGKQNFIPKRVSELTTNDRLLVTLKIPNNGSLKSINLIKLMIEEAPELVKNIRIKGGKHLLFKKSSDVIRNYRSAYWGRDSIPLKLFLDKNIVPEDVKIFFMPSKKSIYLQNIIKITPELCRLLGYYVAEGSSKNGKNLYLIFGKGDKKNKTFDDAVYCIKKSFGINSNLQEPRKNPFNKKITSFPIAFGGSLLSQFFIKVFRIGSNAKNKELPFILFNVPDDLKFEFLKGYLRGDGYLRARTPINRKNWSAEIIAKTASRKLASDLVVLSLQLSLLPSISTELTQERTLYGKRIRKSFIYKITYSRKKDLEKLKDVYSHKKDKLMSYLNKISERSTINIAKKILADFVTEDNKRDLVKVFGKSFYSAYKNLSYERIKDIFDESNTNDKTSILMANLIKNNMVILPIKKIEKIKSEYNEVFDIEVPETNMFIGGVGPILLHNTGGGIIPSLKAAQTLCDCIVNNKNYNKEFKRQSGRELLLHLKIRNMLNKFSDKDYDKLLNLMCQEKVRRILKRYDRDTPIPLVANLLLKEPRFLYFSKAFFS